MVRAQQTPSTPQACGPLHTSHWRLLPLSEDPAFVIIPGEWGLSPQEAVLEVPETRLSSMQNILRIICSGRTALA